MDHDLGRVCWCPHCGPLAKSPMKRMDVLNTHFCDLCNYAYKIEADAIPHPETEPTPEAFSHEQPDNLAADSPPDPGFDSGRRGRGKGGRSGS